MGLSIFKPCGARGTLDKTYRDLILGHSLEGMDRHYIKPSEESLREAMARYTAWLDEQLGSVDQTVDQESVVNA